MCRKYFHTPLRIENKGKTVRVLRLNTIRTKHRLFLTQPLKIELSASIVPRCYVLSIVSLVIIRADIIRADKVPGNWSDSHWIGGCDGHTTFDSQMRRFRLS